MLYSEGCRITLGGSWNEDEVIAERSRRRPAQIAEAVEVGRASRRHRVLAIGGNEQTSREAWTLNHMGDRTSLDLIGRQQELVDAMVATGKAGRRAAVQRPSAVDAQAGEQVPAILECWYLGQESGDAVAEVLFGERIPGGKLPISIPRRWGTCRRSTTTSRRRGAAICSTT